mmetsp:Transcript_6066/g.17357  ORF Transcript_6066/g.17357 Transcript_6066/m.17357 type:complete len:487 (-) Transcript_6066:1411-2871(-)|eukprot:CAMPEP_0206144294 /NCGR_PEP_ID=MMETSP1473-20131121/23639_1 /ASSEMBLY_ACC=CAM_ASM_001109 /TAXON_ID=1461547 /ORGANISM="Stichococcus sp, Strain RCC1054" /LENGTH=486 /DNA_ID=CAMNT_0053540071 /DNA_START=114 /DNA_END=1574 /DNA_ORIENTATION=-
MDPRHGTGLLSTLIPGTYARQGAEAIAKRQKLVTSLLSERRMPQHGWDDANIESLLQDLAAMDSNNFLGTAGVGEREARVACPLVAQRHYRLAHGIGRSGEIAAPQPKAAGSSTLAKLTELLAGDALRTAGLPETGAVTVLPLATGMAITVTLLALRSLLPKPCPRVVLWPRIDQKTCLKAIVSAGFEAVVINNTLEGDEVRTDLAALEAEVHNRGAAAVACIVTTTSCFAPRGADKIVEVAKLCAKHGIAHIVNNAYGVQCAQLCKLLTAACRRGRVDAYVQSTDKNFMVPVGGAIVAAPSSNISLVEAINKVYPGRASVSPILDLFITLLHWGTLGWQAELQRREQLFPYLRAALQRFADDHGEVVLDTPDNPISIGVTLQNLIVPCETSSASVQGPSFLGAMLFNRSVSGARVVAPGKKAIVAGIEFEDYGGHIDGYGPPYITAAAALGTTEADVDLFISKLDACYRSVQKHNAHAEVNPGSV